MVVHSYEFVFIHYDNRFGYLCQVDIQLSHVSARNRSVATVSKLAVSILPSRWEAGFAQSPAKPIRGTTLHALLCLLFPDRIALRFGFPDAPRSFGFCRQCICWRISRSLWNGTGGFGRGSDLLIFGGTGLVCGFLLSAPFWWSDGGCLS